MHQYPLKTASRNQYTGNISHYQGESKNKETVLISLALF
jgi:hypothetical protein